jgi:hypothetical protein
MSNLTHEINLRAFVKFLSTTTVTHGKCVAFFYLSFFSVVVVVVRVSVQVSRNLSDRKTNHFDFHLTRSYEKQTKQINKKHSLLILI